MRGGGRHIPCVSVLFTNIRSVINKRDSLASAIDTTCADVVVLTETWLHSQVQNNEIFQTTRNFTIYRCDRNNRQGGGVLLAISEDLKSHCIHIPSNLEILWAIIELGYQKIIVGVCYRPPDHTSDFINDLHDITHTVSSRYPSLPLFLLGDFSIPNINWATEPPTVLPLSTLAKEFVDLCSVFSFSQVVHEPTKTTFSTANTIDLVLTTSPDVVSNIT